MSSIAARVKQWYADNQISPTDFHCKHAEACKAACEKNGSPGFTESREPCIGEQYEHCDGAFPRLLFISLDAGGIDKDEKLPEGRTVTKLRTREENIKNLPKNRHWYLTHEMAWKIMKKFKPDLELEDTPAYFAHTNAAKCCANKENSQQAPHEMFQNCQEYLRGEIEVLNPDIIITQGNEARDAMANHYGSCGQLPSWSGGGCKISVNGHEALWLHTYHPRNGKFYSLRGDEQKPWELLTSITSDFYKPKAS